MKLVDLLIASGSVLKRNPRTKTMQSIFNSKNILMIAWNIDAIFALFLCYQKNLMFLYVYLLLLAFVSVCYCMSVCVFISMRLCVCHCITVCECLLLRIECVLL